MVRRKSRGKKFDKRSNPVYVFFVEGWTGVNYINRLNSLYTKYITPIPIGREAVSVMEDAEEYIIANEKDVLGYGLWFDADKYNPKKHDNLRRKLERKYSCKFYMNEPCIENWILAHFEKIKRNEHHCKNLKRRIRIKYIKDYKERSKDQINKYITEENIPVAIKNYPEIGKIPQDYFINQGL